jgi:hypothetical protein
MDETVHKSRRTTDTLEDEEVFLLGDSPTGITESLQVTRLKKKEEAQRSRKLARFEPELRPQTLSQRRHSKIFRWSTDVSKATQSLSVSPPTSRRKPAPSSTTILVGPSSPPVTPTKAKKGKKRTAQIVQDLPVRDSPDNPFLDSPSDDRKPNVIKTPCTPPSNEEKRTITYVLYVSLPSSPFSISSYMCRYMLTHDC